MNLIFFLEYSNYWHFLYIFELGYGYRGIGILTILSCHKITKVAGFAMILSSLIIDNGWGKFRNGAFRLPQISQLLC